MNIYSFLYLSSIYLFFNLFNGIENIDYNYQLIFSASLIFTVGIAHGSIDNYLLQKKYKFSNFKFYTLYLTPVILHILMWFVVPTISFCLFLIFSAYHFGESHFSDYNIKSNFKFVLYFSWGCMLLSSLILFNNDELISLSINYNNSLFLFIYSSNIIPLVCYISIAMTLMLIIYLLINRIITIHDFISEVFHFGLIILTFFLFPILISFTLYFIFIHSFRSLNHEFVFLKSKKIIFSLKDFILILLPHTIIAQIFSLFFLMLISFNIITISIPIALLMIISVITIPHVVVMSAFYSN
ncbi:MAG: hypothetical protein CBD51_002155 [Flavobacteriales bacterium TMED191]|nr:MAG: hypothetical protein CBD51_002155 [Flavobacteriales bacterium TMED191]